MEILSLLDKDRDKWIKIVINLGCPAFYAEDVVQDMYIKIALLDNNKRIMYEDSGEVNYWYIILTLRSVCYDFLKSHKKYVDWEPIEMDQDTIDLEREAAFERLYQKIIAATNEFGKYGSKLTQIYFKTDYSLRQIASETTISLSSIFHSIKGYKIILQQRFGEDFEDYINGDYNHIKE
jgi:DNA-directed RNA polymerase specialized sigma24 family protein